MSSQSKKRTSPQEKKRLDYENQRRGFSEYAHALRHGKWRKKRRSVQRPERRAVAIVLAGARGTHADLDSVDVDPGVIARKQISKWGASKLKDWIHERFDGRTRRFAWNLFKNPYMSEKHRLRFVAVLIDLIPTRLRSALPVARRFDLLLNALESGEAIHERGLNPRDRLWQRLEANDWKQRASGCVSSS